MIDLILFSRAIAQLVARMHGVHEAGSSSLPSPIEKKNSLTQFPP